MEKEIQFNEKIKSICRQVYENNKIDDVSGEDINCRNRFVDDVVSMIGRSTLIIRIA